MSDTTRDLAYDQAQGTAATLADIWQAIDHVDGARAIAWHDVDECEECADIRDEYGTDDASELIDHLEGMALEVVWELGEPFAVVLGTGGPHVEIRGGTRHDGAGYAVHVYWSGEHAVARGAAVDRTGEHFRALVDESY